MYNSITSSLVSCLHGEISSISSVQTLDILPFLGRYHFSEPFFKIGLLCNYVSETPSSQRLETLWFLYYSKPFIRFHFRLYPVVFLEPEIRFGTRLDSRKKMNRKKNEDYKLTRGSSLLFSGSEKIPKFVKSTDCPCHERSRPVYCPSRTSLRDEIGTGILLKGQLLCGSDTIIINVA